MTVADEVRTSALSNMNSPIVGLGSSSIGTPMAVFNKNALVVNTVVDPYLISQGDVADGNENIVIHNLPNLGLYLELYHYFVTNAGGAAVFSTHPVIQVFGMLPFPERKLEGVDGRLLPWDISGVGNPNAVAGELRTETNPKFNELWIPLNTPDASAFDFDFGDTAFVPVVGAAFNHLDTGSGDTHGISEKIFVALVGCTRAMVLVTTNTVFNVTGDSSLIIGRVVG